MARTGLWLRVFIALLLASLPPILLLVGTVLLAESLFPTADPNLVAILVVVGTVIWAAILGVIFARVLAEDIRALLSLAERGGETMESEVGAAHQQLASALDERNRQVATLAHEAGQVPIDAEPRQVVSALVSAVRSVMRDPTWRCAVLTSDSPDRLPPGIYGAPDDPGNALELSDLERWASVSGAGAPVARLEGPWGAFMVVDVAVSERLGAILYAPWEGRRDPSAALIDLLRLVGQHTGAALEHSMLYARVRSQADELTRMAAVQKDFLRGVTHDLQTPLTSISALATELRADGSLQDDARADLDTIAHQADRLRRMVGQLLIASRLEAGAFTPNQEVFAARPLIERTWASLRAQRPFDLTVEGEAHLVVGDPDRVEQVLWAILDNAVKYSPAGSSVAVSITPDDGMLAICITDRGAGMDEVSRARAFEQFYRSDHARKLAPDGSGVGLYASRGLIEAMGGTIAIASTLGGGTTVILRVPAEPAAEVE